MATLIAKNYLPFARVLAESLHRWHPELPLFVGLMDEPEGRFDPAGEAFSVVKAEQLAIPDWRDFCFRYTRREAVSAAKPYLISALLEDFESVLFLDADMIVLGDLSPLLKRVAARPLTLTPHAISPGLPVEAELNFLQCGVYNGGVVGVSKTAAAVEFLGWWRDRTREHCRYSLAEGLHLDQRWLDYAPSFVPGLGVERDPAYNVAYWNVAERPEASAWRLFHCSGFDPERLDQVCRYWPAKQMAEVGAARALLQEYGARVLAAGYGETRSWPYFYDCFANGEIISPGAREAYGRLGRAAGYFGDPFGTEMQEWLAERIDPGKEEEMRQWREAAEARLEKLRVANVMLRDQQVELDRLRNELAGERELVTWHAARAAMFERAAEERRVLLERLAGS